MEPRRLLVVEDDDLVGALVRDVARQLDYEVEWAADAPGFQSLYESFDPRQIFLDLQLRETDAIELIQYLAAHGSRAKILLSSGRDARALIATQRFGSSRGLHMAGVLPKPFSLKELASILESFAPRARSFEADEIRSGIRRGEFVLHYQPRVGLKDRGVHSLEALVRWMRPGLGQLMPVEFLAQVERHDLCGELTEAVVERAVDQCARWRDQGLDLRIAVNYWPQLLSDETLPDRLQRVLRSHNLAPDVLTIETTEGSAVKDPMGTMEVMTRLRIAGVGLAIDDFGTGYASLAELWRLPFNELKIDRSFVGEAVENPEARAIVRALIELGHNLGLQVVAEGVENLETWQLLREGGCDLAQGFFLEHPLEPHRLPAWMRYWGYRSAALAN